MIKRLIHGTLVLCLVLGPPHVVSAGGEIERRCEREPLNYQPPKVGSGAGASEYEWLWVRAAHAEFPLGDMGSRRSALNARK